MANHTLHLISNAHLDPMWMWQWEEGAVEALSTFRVAVDLLQDFPGYIFVRNDSLLYEWVEEADPAVFQAITNLARSGRWVVAGGWYTQPDCNIPGGESIVRQILYGKKYFIEKFGVEPSVAYNVDSFGHSGGLPQILSQSGYKYYIHCRPRPEERDLPGDLYVWRGVDGSEVIACRPPFGKYGTAKGEAASRVLKGIELVRQIGRDAVVLWGIGDHGGGASRKDLNALNDVILATEDVDVVHSHPQAFFDSVRGLKETLPVVEGDLQQCYAGCYTSAAVIKRAHRQAEGLIAQAERLATLAHYYTGSSYPRAELDSAWKDLLFNEFHDTLAGTTSGAVSRDAMDIFGRCNTAARKVRWRSMLQLADQDCPDKEAISVYVFNPHAFDFTGPVEVDFMADYTPSRDKAYASIADSSGFTVRHQEEKPISHLPYEWHKKALFQAEVPALGWSRYTIRTTAEPVSAVPRVTLTEDEDRLIVETGALRAEFDRHTGLMGSLRDLSADKELLSAPAFVPKVFDDRGDSWGRAVTAFNDFVGTFEAAGQAACARITGNNEQQGETPRLQVVENGPIRLVLESFQAWGASTAVLRFNFYPEVRYFEVKLRIDWHEPRRMLKLSIPTSLAAAKVRCEIPYGVIEREADATEHVGQRWVMLESDRYAFGVINTGQYAFDAKDGELRVSLLRSPAFCHMDPMELDANRAYDFMDLGVHEITLGVVFGDAAQTVSDSIRAANLLNIPLSTLTYSPVAEGKHQSHAAVEENRSFLTVSPGNVVLSALKLAEDGQGFVARLHESAGIETDAELMMENSQALRLRFGRHELKTLRILPQGDAWEITENDLLERARDRAE